MAMGLCLYWADKDYAAALKEFSIAAVTSPNEPDILQYIGGIYRRQGRWRESLATYDRAQDLDPRNLDVITHAAVDHLLVRDWAATTAGYNRALELAPDSAACQDRPRLPRSVSKQQSRRRQKNSAKSSCQH